MNKAYFFAILLLIGGVTGCMTNTDDDLIDVSGSEAIYVVTSKIFVDSFNDALYGTICDKLMYEDGSFYNEGDSSTCLNGANDGYNEGLDAVLAPDWEYVNFENTGKKAALTGDIYKVSGIGIYCRGTKSNDCEANRFSDFVWLGIFNLIPEIEIRFRTTDGGYLKVVMPNH